MATSNMNVSNGLSGLDDLPLALRLLWDRSRRHSGLSAFRGFYYQYIYSLCLIAELLETKTYNAFACECIEDFLAWRNDPSGNIEKVLLVQVKSSAGRCFIRNEKEVKNVLESFTKAITIVKSETSAELKCRLVYNWYHDCQRKNCFDLFHKYPAYETFATKISELFPTINSENLIEFKTFLPLPLDRESFMKEVGFLEKFQPGVLKFLEAEENLGKFVRSLFAVIAPFYNPHKRRSLDGVETKSEPLLWRLHRDQIHVVSELRDVLNEAVEQARSNARQSKFAQAFEIARHNANIEFQVARSRIPQHEKSLTIVFDSPDTTIRALSILHALDRANDSIFFSAGKYTLTQDYKYFRLSSPIGGKVPLHEFLRRQGRTHRMRIHLILSFIKTVVTWAHRGVVLTGFRADNLELRDLYLVQSDEKGVHFVLADIEVLSLIDETSGLFNSRWLRGEVLAKALRYLYYGKVTNGGIRRTRLFRAQWNDNIVNDLANWLESMVFVESTELEIIIAELFRDETSGWPLIVSHVETQFVLDVGDAGIESVAHAVSNAWPESLIEDRGLYHRRLLYALWNKAQLGLINNPADKLKLYRYIEYFTKRWDSAKSHDLDMAVPIKINDERKPTLVCIQEDDDIRAICTEVFGISYKEYAEWLARQVRAAKDKRSAKKLPPILTSERILHRYHQTITDSLRDPLFKYRLVADQPTSKGDRLVSILIKDGIELVEHLNRLGYKPKSRRSLTIRARDKNWQHTDSSYYLLRQMPDGSALAKVILAADSEMSKEGYIRVVDKGTEAVLNSEETLFRYLEDSESEFSDYTGVIPVRKAWGWLEPIIGSDSLTRLSDDGLWRDEICEVPYVELDEKEDCAGKILDAIQNRKDGDPYWHIITGAAGTGKTHETASLVFQYLEDKRSDRQYPPRRVLIVSYSHFGVDNFDNAFYEISGGLHTPYRFITPPRKMALKEAGLLNKKVLDRSEANCERLRPTLPKPSFSSKEGISFNTYRAKLGTEIVQTELALSNTAGTNIPFALISGHEKWRSWYARHKSWRPTHELATTLENLRTRLKRLESYAQIEKPPGSMTVGASTSNFELYEKFAAEVIETTVDAFDRLPDMFFDLVVVEEASQIGALKLLKIMTKIARARGDMGPPDLVLSGDPRQLPPFHAVSQLDAVYYSPDSRMIELLDPEIKNEIRDYPKQEPLFSRICKRHQSRTSILQTQRRMHPDIATLVNSLFYSGQSWKTTHPDVGEGVAWYDTSCLKPEVQIEEGGTSRFNKIEGDVVRSLVRHLLNQGEKRILVISPYLAQVIILADEFGMEKKVQVRTIDGCQGIEEDTVIVSFVTFRFSQDRDFVVDPRRMNVALSRARNSLYLVGNYDEAISCIRRLNLPNQYRHIIGLTDLFQTGARFGHKLHPANSLPGFKNDSTR